MKKKNNQPQENDQPQELDKETLDSLEKMKQKIIEEMVKEGYSREKAEAQANAFM